jgi:uncharacterized membrane protein
MSEIEPLRQKILALYQRRRLADIDDRSFQRQTAHLILDLCRALTQIRLIDGETILHEHHAVRAHPKMIQSILKESDQELISIFATNTRLIQWRTMENLECPPIFESDQDHVFSEIGYDQILALKHHREWRYGEVVAGLVMIIGAYLFRSVLLFTSSALILVGALGMGHGLFIPTSWLEIMPRLPSDSHLEILAMRKKSARKLIKYVKSKIPG